jgi:hypothetical protein
MGPSSSINRTAFSATMHCLTGCSIGEIAGMIISSALGWAAAPSIALAVALAFVFGYGLSMLPLLRHGLGIKQATRLALASDTISIGVMELVDNAFILLIPGAIHAGLGTGLFWVSLGLSLAVAFVVALPVNRYLIARGKGHAVMHEHH